MEGREAQHHQPLKLCQFLYTFFMKLFARKTPRAIASRTSNECTEVPIYDSSSPVENSGDAFAGIAINGYAREKGKQEEEAKVPKKMVRINENVKDINSIMKERRKSKMEKADSFGHQQEQDPQPKRLRSILRVGSDLNETSHSILS